MGQLSYNFVGYLVSICVITSQPGWVRADSLSPPTNVIGGAQHVPNVEDSEVPEDDLSARFVDATFDNNYGSEEEAAEGECPRGQWWHIRGQRCVPFKCIGGNKFRNIDTGECLLKTAFGNNDWMVGKSFSRYTPRTQMKSNKARLRFGFPTKVKG